MNTQPICYEAYEGRAFLLEADGTTICEIVAPANNDRAKIARDLAHAQNSAARMQAALDRIASWGEGPVVHGGFDEPGAAQIARDTIALNQADMGNPISEPAGPKTYTVLLQRPDYLSDNPGLDTYMTTVRAMTVAEAQTAAQLEAAQADNNDLDRDDYAVLLVIEGERSDIKED